MCYPTQLLCTTTGSRNRLTEILFTGTHIADTWLFMQSPIPVVLTLALYLYFVLNLGPKLMKNRQAFELKNALIFYNAYQVLFSSWLCSLSIQGPNLVKHIFNYSCGSATTNFTVKYAVGVTVV